MENLRALITTTRLLLIFILAASLATKLTRTTFPVIGQSPYYDELWVAFSEGAVSVFLHMKTEVPDRITAHQYGGEFGGFTLQAGVRQDDSFFHFFSIHYANWSVPWWFVVFCTASLYGALISYRPRCRGPRGFPIGPGAANISITCATRSRLFGFRAWLKFLYRLANQPVRNQPSYSLHLLTARLLK